MTIEQAFNNFEKMHPGIELTLRKYWSADLSKPSQMLWHATIHMDRDYSASGRTPVEAINEAMDLVTLRKGA